MDIIFTNILIGLGGLLVLILGTAMATAFILFIGNEIATSFGLENSYCNLSLRNLVLGIISVSIVIYILYLLGAFIVAYE